MSTRLRKSWVQDLDPFLDPWMPQVRFVGPAPPGKDFQV